MLKPTVIIPNRYKLKSNIRLFLVSEACYILITDSNKIIRYKLKE
jgi:hypothetical protein